MIRIRSKRHNFRRCGMPHPKGPAEYPDGRFTEEEVKILQAEPMLIVEVIPDKKDTDPLKEMTVAQLKKLLDDMQVEYPDGAKKQDLIELIKSQPGKDGE